jgi:DNA sulfur modification protein DndD
MIIEKLTLQNIGLYGGTHVFNLCPDSPTKPIILFGGLNGAGKTTFLDALQLCLYGRQARCSNRGDLAYGEFLHDTMTRGTAPETGASISIQYRRTTEGREEHFVITRAWADSGKGMSDRVEVLRNGSPAPVLGESWAEYIEAYLPSRIANLFFFDGEQIKELAEQENAAAMLKSAIHSLLGLDLVDRLHADLLVVERRKRLAAKTDATRQKLKVLETDCERHEKLLADAVLECAAAQTAYDRSLKRLADAEKRYRQEGGDLFERRTQLEECGERLQTAIRVQEEQVRELAAGALPLSLLQDQLLRLEQQITNEIAFNENQLLLALLEQRDRQTLKLLAKQNCPQNALKKLSDFLGSDRSSREAIVGDEPFLKTDAGVRDSIRVLRGSSLPALVDEARTCVAELERLHQGKDILDAQLAQVPLADSVATVTKGLHDAQATVRDAKARLDAFEAKKGQIERDLSAKRLVYSRELETDTYAQIHQEEEERILHYSARVRETLERFKAAAVARRIVQLENLIFASFSQLIRKAHFLSAIHINPENFAVSLITTAGKPLPVARLSAGERQLLATSMLWGLARASGRIVPTVIDTPLGRLDSSHREHLVERYFPVASHQVILLSTNEEIRECHLDKLRPFVTRSYLLDYDAEKRLTTPQEGYFWK